jgi:uncharacterized protein YjiS (DUF1127 family)
MSLPILEAIFVPLIAKVAAWKRRQARLRENARTIRYLEDMPAYLRNDIGLPPGADVSQLVETGRAWATAGRERHRNFAIMPHAT